MRTRCQLAEPDVDPCPSTRRHGDIQSPARALCGAAHDVETEACAAGTRAAPLHDGEVSEPRAVIGDREYLADEETFVWIYANPIYIES